MYSHTYTHTHTYIYNHTAILIHGAVTFFLVDKLGGNFKQLADQYIIKFIPKTAVEKIEAKLK